MCRGQDFLIAVALASMVPGVLGARVKLQHQHASQGQTDQTVSTPFFCTNQCTKPFDEGDVFVCMPKWQKALKKFVAASCLVRLKDIEASSLPNFPYVPMDGCQSKKLTHTMKLCELKGKKKTTRVHYGGRVHVPKSCFFQTENQPGWDDTQFMVAAFGSTDCQVLVKASPEDQAKLAPGWDSVPSESFDSKWRDPLPGQDEPEKEPASESPDDSAMPSWLHYAGAHDQSLPAGLQPGVAGRSIHEGDDLQEDAVEDIVEDDEKQADDSGGNDIEDDDEEADHDERPKELTAEELEFVKLQQLDVDKLAISQIRKLWKHRIRVDLAVPNKE